MADKNYYCTKCGVKFPSSTPTTTAGTCDHTIIHESGRDLINVLNTIEDCTITDAPSVINAIRADTMKRYKNI